MIICTVYVYNYPLWPNVKHMDSVHRCYVYQSDLFHFKLPVKLSKNSNSVTRILSQTGIGGDFPDTLNNTDNLSWQGRSSVTSNVSHLNWA